MRRRIINIISRMLEGTDFYTNRSPRISSAEIRELESLGLFIQRESIWGAEARSPIAVYIMGRSTADAQRLIAQ